MNSEYKNCTLCARKCGVDRSTREYGFCRSGSRVSVARASLHMWEEPIISGNRGSGTVFFSGCSLGCIFCQNREISRKPNGVNKTPTELAKIFLSLEEQGAHNINLVTPSHFVPSIKDALIIAKKEGLSVPIVYNTGSYDTPETLKMLDGLVDIYLPDFKYFLQKSAKKFSSASNYPDTAKTAIAEMFRQTGVPKLENGLMLRGVIVRILLLPNHVAEAKLILKYLFTEYGDGIFISLMNQYTPMPNMPKPLDRRVTHAEYDDLCAYALKLGVKNCYTQDSGTASESFIPAFDLSGVE